MTSVTSNPYTITDISYFVLDKSHPEICGRLAISMAPGKKDKKWDRDLDLDLATIKANGIQIIVCLLEWSEMKRLQISHYPKRAQEEGFLFYHLPIKDGKAPLLQEAEAIVPILVDHLTAGYQVLIHCRGGFGRAGTISACCLSHFEFSAEDAIELVRQQRPGAIQTSCQVNCISHYNQTLNLV